MANRPIDGWHLTPFLELYEQGVRLFQIDATCSEDIYHPQIRAWVAPDQFDYSAQETYWKRLLAKCPDATLCLRLYVASPPWWDQTHREELQQYSDGRVEHEFQRTERKTLPSLASETWHRDAVLALNHFLSWLDSSGWTKKVWGLVLSYGITWEWGILGSDDFLDYSEPMRHRFRCWLRATYGTEEALRESWDDPVVTLEDAEIPSPKARMRGDGDFRVFPRDRPAYDFQRCLSDVNADYLLMLARAVRGTAGDRYTLGACYGYTLTAREHSEIMGQYGAGGFQGGHHALGRVAKSGLFNFIGSPFAYVNRDLYDGLLIQHYPLRSIQEHGLHGYDENDLWTFTNPPKFEVPISVGYTPTREESIAHQRLALGQSLCRGTSYWWTELTEWIGPYARNFLDPEILAELRHHHDLFERLVQGGPGRSNAQIALIIEEAAVGALALDSKFFLREVYQQLPRWAWCGAPFDVWLASDITPDNMQPYRLVYVFAPFLTDPRRQTLRQALCHSDRTVWWGPYTGWLENHGTDPHGFETLTGFSDPVPPSGMPGAQKREGWKSLYGSCANLSDEQLSKIAENSGVHLYGKAPLHVLASEWAVCVHVARGGSRALRLPRGRPWRDIFSGRILEHDAFDFSEAGVALFLRGTF